jgi:hypothetical protein
MKLTITLDMDNAAFQDDLRRETARILDTVPDRVLEVLTHQTFRGGVDATEKLLDLNGNSVGQFHLVRAELPR